LPVWMRIWPIAVGETNSRPERDDDTDLSVTDHTADDREPMDLDTLNTPAGKLVGVFLTACPTIAPGSNTFTNASMERQMRDVVIAAPGRSGLIAQHRLIEQLPYFLAADRDWAQQYLITPLLNDDGASLALWRAIARRTQFTEVLKFVGRAMAERATDRRLGRETRRSLVFSLVVESLHAYREARDPAVPGARVQQMLRTLDDEVRASAANAVQQFVRDLSSRPPNAGGLDGGVRQDTPATAAALFRSAAVPFLRDVWPQERSLATPGVSRAFADLPVVSGDAFAEAVHAVARFLVPFECWSLFDYGLNSEENGQKNLAVIDDEAKAKALLRLLDLTVGTSEGAVVPHDLTDALERIAAVAPNLAMEASYRRLETATRR
jgi:hypothetical protein